MPTYDYKCDACGRQFERFQSITASPLRKCPTCGKLKLRRLIGPGAGLIFKGSGFYITDYRSEGYKSAAKGESATDAKPATEAKAATDAAQSKSKTEAKPEPKKKSK
jgi:putative FmdB family regulatory protein